MSFEPETGLFTAVELTGGSGAGNHEAAVAVRLLAGEETAVTVLGDAAYGTGELRGRLEAAGHAMVIKLPPPQPAVPGGFTGDDFTIDDQAGTAACPAGHTVPLGRPHADGTRLAQFKALCRGCPLRQRCTTSKTGRVLSVHPQHALLAAARRARRRPRLERRVPQMAAPGRTGHRLARRPRQPPCPLPRHHQQQHLAPPPGRRPQPPPLPTSGSPAPPTAPGHSHNSPPRVPRTRRPLQAPDPSTSQDLQQTSSSDFVRSGRAAGFCSVILA